MVRNRPGPKGITENMIAEALRKNAGNVLGAAQALGITDGAIYARIRNHPHLGVIQQEAKERVTELCKARILKRIERDDWPAIKLWMTTQAGWATQTALQNPDGTPLAVSMPEVHFHVTYVGEKPEGEDVV